MKRLFSKKKSAPPSPIVAPPPPPPMPVVHTTGLQPKYLVPPVPHPRPHDHIALVPTADGLLLRPHSADGSHSGSHVRIAWGKTPKVEELDGDADSANWSEGAIVYGIVGVLELYTASHLLVITSKSDVGHLLDASRTIYASKGVTAIPLFEERARTVIHNLVSMNAAKSRMSLIASHSPQAVTDTLLTADPDDVDPGSPSETEPRVKFADEHEVKVMSPQAGGEFDIPDRPPSPSSLADSGASTPSSEYSANTSPVVKTLTERLSFWSRLSKRQSFATIPIDGEAPNTPAEERESLDESVIHGSMEEPSDVLHDILTTTAPPPATVEEKNSELEQKILRQTVKDFSKGEMYFAYNFDITRSLQHKQDQIAKSQKQNALLAELNVLDSVAQSVVIGEKVDVLAEPSPTLPLWRRVDRQFWWNEHLSKPFIDAGLHSYVLPIVQGFFQIASFPVPGDPGATESSESVKVDYIIMSRRSRDRAGLRYQRRGIDDDAHVANFVETETIVRVDREGATNIFSYVQIRGSIPIYWSQSGYSLKPPPQLSKNQTHEQNLDALSRHFKRTLPAYGPHTIVNLAEQHGKEGVVTAAYRDFVHEVKLPDVKYCEYDFHAETKGMKYENISNLIAQLERTFEAQGFLWISDQLVLSRQQGIFRVNCIDCLDRTNVVQSAFARHVLNRQLLAVALLNPSESGRTDIDVVFNDVWANNGDAISRSYAGTSALKGDFTRTGKRDLGGLLNDGMNSLARMYTSTFSDWFCQAVIDYMLGNRTLTVFSEFLLRLQSTDPRDLIRLSKIRAEAIATSVSRVLTDGERLLSGWTLFSPTELNTKLGEKFEEKVLILSGAALYIISYDYNLEKVKLYTRIPLGDIVGISKGAYILSPLEEASRDPIQNAGFTVEWLNSNQLTRVTSYSVRNSLDIPSTPLSSSPTKPSAMPTSTTTTTALPAPAAPARGPSAARLSRLLNNAVPPWVSDTSFAAFKALPIDPARRRGSTLAEPAADELAGAATCREAVDLMVDAIVRACEDVGGAQGRGGAPFVTEQDVVSLAEARKVTSVYAKMEYGVKRLLWLGG
ncbi:hypothetical protein BV25DRAFT_670160 [Artomyces pyxidatus]|uniref:Uncharacterized protein n=1 Tax=Artomyces pyxidatus TaxID=48021 RepID=A0ACB8T2G4_9AGAM|nr:hypothetical protein BV25DRAFT_670160 [Artomyces pyxidatus]